MKAPVSMIKGVDGKASTSLVLALLLGFAVIAMINKPVPSQSRSNIP